MSDEWGINGQPYSRRDFSGSTLFQEDVYVFDNSNESSFLSIDNLRSFTVNKVVFQSIRQFLVYRLAILCSEYMYTDKESVLSKLWKTGGDKVKLLALQGLLSEYLLAYSEWSSNKLNTLLQGYLCKLSDEEFKSLEEKIVVNADVDDRFYGTGLSIYNKGIYSPDDWLGENQLGFCIMWARDIKSLWGNIKTSRNDEEEA